MKRVIEEADGIQPHLVAPEAGYRRLLEEALGYLKDPTEKSVEEVGARHVWQTCGSGWAGAGGCLGGGCRRSIGRALWSSALRRRRLWRLLPLLLLLLLPERQWPTSAAAPMLPTAPPSSALPRPAQVFVLLRRMVDNIANSDEVRALRRYPTLRREIVTAAYRALEKFKEETRKMVNIMVEMERNYITAEYFRTIQVRSGWGGGRCCAGG